MKYYIFIIVAVLMLPMGLSGQSIKGIDEIAPFSEGLAAIRKGNQWGFINEDGVLVIDYRSDLYWNEDADTSKSDVLGVKYPMFKKGRCLITENVEDGVPVFGYINTNGDVIVAPKFLNVYPFSSDGYATGVLYMKTFKGENEFKLKVYDFKFFDVLFDTSGEIIEYLEKRDNIQMTRP